MNYPFWQVPAIGGGFLIALISVMHVYIAHLAVGGGLFLVWTERKARREGDSALLAYVKKHTRFFLLLTMVFGGVTGVGIWFIISLVHPSGTSSLIHNFVFGWATEWTFFVGEIVALLIYYYLFEKLRPKAHMAIGWLYFVFAWLSLFVVNGILSYMLTPGRWLETGSFWDGFFNPTFWPSLVFRTGIAVLFAGLFGLWTALVMPNGGLRTKLTRYCARWMLAPFVLLVLGGLWYLRSIPEEPVANLLARNPAALPHLKTLLWSTVILFGAGLISLIRLPRGLFRAISLALILVGLAWMSGFEYLREIARKPYVIFGHMYSTSITTAQAEEIRAEGFLTQAKWTTLHELTDENRLEAGRELMVHQCMICHTLGAQNDLVARTHKFNEFGLARQLDGQGQVFTYMPPFLGTPAERDALAAYIVQELDGFATAEETPVPIEKRPTAVPDFDPSGSEYALFVWNDLGMHCVTDSDPFFVILPPANTIWAQLVRRGPVPELVTDGVEIRYAVERGYEHPDRHVRFWDFAEQNFGRALEPPLGLTGNGLSGKLQAKPEKKAFVVEKIPVVPYRDDGGFNPFPLVEVSAHDAESGALLAATYAVAPTSTEMGCRNCHGGPWRVGGRAGVSLETALDILRVHDRHSRTDLLAEAAAGRPRLCQSCHADPAVGTAGEPGLLNLSAAMHGFHANYMPEMAERACLSCHPSRPEGPTRCLRGRHGAAGLTCVECHGEIRDHALSLLIHERDAGKPGAERLMRNLEPQEVAEVAEIHGRMPWLNEPDCLNCHVNFQLESIAGFNQWTLGAEALFRNRADCRGMMCTACHNSPHAIYPATNPYGENRDNIQPLQYQGIAGTIGTEGACEVCHRQAMAAEGHHARMARR